MVWDEKRGECGIPPDVIMLINKLRVFFVKSLREKVNLHP